VEVWGEDAFLTEVPEGRVDTRDVLLQLDSRGSLAYTHPLGGVPLHQPSRKGFTERGGHQRPTAASMRFDALKRDARPGRRRAPRRGAVYVLHGRLGRVSTRPATAGTHGADPFEQARYVVDSLPRVLLVQRTSRATTYEWEPATRSTAPTARYLSYLTNIYQQLFFGGDYDGIQSTYRWLAANAGLNLVEEIMMMPNYGEYVYDKRRAS
jgi:hypothetical protein